MEWPLLVDTGWELEEILVMGGVVAEEVLINDNACSSKEWTWWKESRSFGLSLQHLIMMEN